MNAEVKVAGAASPASDDTSRKLQTISKYLQKKVKPCIDDTNGGGVHVQSDERLKRGDEIISCHALAMALDPPHRHLCAYCACPCNTTCSNPTTSRCEQCFVVSICQKCKDHGVDRWHEESGECMALSCLVRAHYELFSGGGEKKYGQHQPVSLEMANEVDSSYILTIRIMLRRWSDCQQKLKLELESPLPSVAWSLLDELYTADLGTTPDERQHYDAAVTELCRIMRESFVLPVVQDGDGSNSRDESCWINKTDFDDIMGKVVGCGHAVTDVTVSLGCQCLGRALFLEHSFYNHCCLPNAFLSCHIENGEMETETETVKCCALTARVHCMHDVEEGKPITISYIPTSGLDCNERRQRLHQSYDFTCNCEVCERKTP